MSACWLQICFMVYPKQCALVGLSGRKGTGGGEISERTEGTREITIHIYWINKNVGVVIVHAAAIVNIQTDYTINHNTVSLSYTYVNKL